MQDRCGRCRDPYDARTQGAAGGAGEPPSAAGGAAPARQRVWLDNIAIVVEAPRSAAQRVAGAPPPPRGAITSAGELRDLITVSGDADVYISRITIAGDGAPGVGGIGVDRASGSRVLVSDAVISALTRDASAVLSGPVASTAGSLAFERAVLSNIDAGDSGAITLHGAGAALRLVATTFENITGFPVAIFDPSAAAGAPAAVFSDDLETEILADGVVTGPQALSAAAAISGGGGASDDGAAAAAVSGGFLALDDPWLTQKQQVRHRWGDTSA